MFVSLSSVFLLGLIIGSFVSVVTYRIPRNLGFIKGRSFCDNCKKDLFWYDNVPLFSYIFYLGKSRCCSKKISIRYPLIEVSTAVCFVVLYLSSLSPLYYVLCTISLAIFIIDLEHQIIPDELTWLLLLYAICIMLYGLSIAYNLQHMVYSQFFSGFFFAFLLLMLNLVTKGRGMGLGDVKLAIPLGLWLGLEKGIVWFMYSFIIGGIVAGILLLLKRAKLKTKIAFGPFLILAFWIVLLVYR